MNGGAMLPRQKMLNDNLAQLGFICKNGVGGLGDREATSVLTPWINDKDLFQSLYLFSAIPAL